MLMLYLIEYDRDESHLVRMQTFPDTARTQAENARLELEIALNQRGVHHEVVILEAASEDALKRTHRRYFDDLVGIAQSAGAVGGA